MAIRINNAVAAAMCDAAVDLADAGAGAATVQIRSGAQPAVNGALSGTLLAEFTLSDPAFGAASPDGTDATAAGASFPKTTTGAATGTAGYGAVLDSDDNVLWTGVCGQGSGDFNLSNTSIASGQTVNLNSLNFNVLQQ